jgi:hypothetical protein
MPEYKCGRVQECKADGLRLERVHGGRKLGVVACSNGPGSASPRGERFRVTNGKAVPKRLKRGRKRRIYVGPEGPAPELPH